MLFLSSCRSNAELSMERAEYFYNVNRLEESTLEYNKVINYYGDDRSLNNKNIKILANAHHNLALVLKDLGKFESAIQSHENAIR